MAKLLLLDKAQYFQGEITLFRGDAWELSGRVVERVGNVDQDVDLTGCAATGLFPADGDGFVGGTVTLTKPTAGELKIAVPADETPGVALSDGIALYLHLEDLSVSPITVPTYDEPLVVRDADYTT